MSSSLLKNSIYNILNKGLNVIYPIATTAYISRIFNADGVGIIMFTINIVTYFALAASLGLPNYAVKIISKNRYNEIDLYKCFSELLCILIVSSLFFSAAYYLCVPIIYKSYPPIMLNASYILGLIIVTNILNFDWLFESFEDYGYLAIRSLIVKSLMLILLFTYVKDKNDLLLYCFIYAGISVLNNILNGISYIRYTKLVTKEIRLSQHFKPILYLFFAVFATEMYTLLDSTMLGFMCPPSSLGYYSNSSRVVRATYGIVFSVIAVYSPRLCFLYGSKKIEDYKLLFSKYYQIALLLSIPAFVFLLTNSSLIVKFLFGDDFLPSINLLRLLSPLVLFFSLATVFGHIPLVIFGKEKLLLYATIVGALSNFTLNLILIPLFKHNGAAIASIISEIFVTILLLYYSLKTIRITLFNKNICSIIFSALFMGIILIFVNRIEVTKNLFLHLVVDCIIGFITYLILLVILKNQIIKEIFNRIKINNLI